MQTRRGTRPGDSLADIVFNLVFARVLDEVNAILQEHNMMIELPQKQNRDPLHPSDTEDRLPAFQVTWADDLALMMEFPSVASISRQLAFVAHSADAQKVWYGNLCWRSQDSHSSFAKRTEGSPVQARDLRYY